MPPKIAVVGTSGSGKTTVARALARRLGVPHVELDALFHGPGWTETPAEEFRRRVASATGASGWVVDGNYDSKLGDLVLGRGDTVVWLDMPPRAALACALAEAGPQGMGPSRAESRGESQRLIAAQGLRSGSSSSCHDRSRAQAYRRASSRRSRRASAR